MEAAAKPGEDKASDLNTGGIAVCVITFIVFVVVAIIGLSSNWPTPLVVALFVTAGFVLVESTFLYLWARRYTTGGVGGQDELGNAYADAAKVAITTQGVVLGLVAFQEGRLPNTTLRVAACALVAGVLAASILYLSVAFGPPPDPGRAFAASILFSLAYWCLGFGLICVVAGSWA